MSRSLGAGFSRGFAGLLSSTKFSLAVSRASHAIDRFALLRVLFFWFSASVGLCSGFPRSSSFVLPLLSVAGFSVYLLTSKTESCDEDDDESVGVVEELSR